MQVTFLLLSVVSATKRCKKFGIQKQTWTVANPGDLRGFFETFMPWVNSFFVITNSSSKFFRNVSINSPQNFVETHELKTASKFKGFWQEKKWFPKPRFM